MCEFCVKHGEGEKWYLRAGNYSDDLMSDLRRRKFVEEFFAHPERLEKESGELDRLDRAPGFVRRVIRWRVSNSMKKVHFGQVVPIEDIDRIFAFTNSIVRVGCICRRATTGSNQRYCYAVSAVPDSAQFVQTIRAIDPGYLLGPDNSDLELLTREEAMAAFRAHERESLCHTVWTFVAPFIGGICNCDRSDCMAMRSTVTHDLPVMFRAEYVAMVDPDECNGCRACMRACQFGAIAYSAAHRKAVIDPRRCYGCGVCRSVCNRNSISLFSRSSVAEAAGIW